jgi:hypothetical protein
MSPNGPNAEFTGAGPAQRVVNGEAPENCTEGSRKTSMALRPRAATR